MNIYEEAVIKFGIDKQIIKTAEECSELAQACCKNVLYNDNHENLLLEMVQVHIMTQQLIKYFKWENDFGEILERELIKLSERLK